MYLESKKRHYLTKLRAALLAATQRDEADETNIKSESCGPQGYEDDAHRLAMLEFCGNLVVAACSVWLVWIVLCER